MQLKAKNRFGTRLSSETTRADYPRRNLSIFRTLQYLSYKLEQGLTAKAHSELLVYLKCRGSNKPILLIFAAADDKARK